MSSDDKRKSQVDLKFTRYDLFIYPYTPQGDGYIGKQNIEIQESYFITY